MSLHKINIEWKYAKSYATEAGLMKRIEQDKNLYPEYNDRFFVVRTPEGRWTAIVALDTTKGGCIGRYEFVKV